MIKTNIPKLRFKEFSDEWQGKSLDELTDINPRSDDLPQEFYYIDLDSVSDGKINDIKKINKSSSPSRAQRLLKKDDVLYQTVRPYQKNNYYFNKTAKNYVASTGYAQVRAKESAKYVYQYFHTKRFVDIVLSRCIGTSYPSINSSDLRKIKILVPSEKEQQKIAEFLGVVDEKIEKLEEKKKGFEKYKKGVMQKLFPKKDEKNPEIRFKDENGKNYPDWVEKKISDIFQITRGNVLSKGKLNQVPSDGYNYPVYSSQTAKNGLLGYYNDYLFENCITWTTDGANAGDVNFRVGKFYCTNVCGVLINKKGYSNLCIAEILNRQTRRYVSYVGNPKLMNNVMGIIKIKIPKSTEEQRRIAVFLTGMDVKVTLINKKLEQAKLFKKALLQQMFV